MDLKFKLITLPPSIDLAEKLSKLGVTPFIERIFADLQVLSSTREIILSALGIIDTGAVFSLLPKAVLESFPEILTQSYTLWGIVNKEDCRVEAELAVVTFQLIDDFGMISPILDVPCAFVEDPKVPILIGMKGILAKYSYAFDKELGLFSLIF